jgi:hypothetical protein
MKRFVLIAAGMVAASLLGGVAGYQIGPGASSGADPMTDLFTVAQSRYSSYLFAIRKDRNFEGRADDLSSYLAYLDTRARDQGAANPNVYAFDKALARIRLSQLAQLHGANADAIRLAAEADAICPSTELRRCSANNLLIMARERDRQLWGIPGYATAR